MSLVYVADWRPGQRRSVLVLAELALLEHLVAVRTVAGIAASDQRLWLHTVLFVPHVVGPLLACTCASCLLGTRETPDGEVVPGTCMQVLLDRARVVH